MLGRRGSLEGILHRRRFRVRLFFEGILIGLVTGCVVVLFRYLLQLAAVWLEMLYAFLGSHEFGWTLGWIVALVCIALLLDKMVSIEPMISGSGIPHVKGAVLRQLNMKWLSVLWWKFAGGLLAIGSGMSLGREGPSIQLGAAIGQGINRKLGGFKIEERILLTSGASAGLAAAFNAPLAGVIFSLEELHKNFSPPVLLSAMAASITADYVSRHFFGIRPIFDFHSLAVLPMRFFVLLLLLGLVTGILGTLFNWSLRKSLELYERQNVVPQKLRMLIPLLLTIPIGFWVPQVLGGGQGLIEGLQNNQYLLPILFALLIVKFGLTLFSYGSGAPGGIFMPMLVIGALIGGVFGQLVINFWQVDPIFGHNFVVFAMAAFFTAIVKAPITGSILITEMTGSFEHLPALITVSMTAYIAADLLNSKPIYDLLLHRILAKQSDDGKNLYRSGNTVLEAVVSLGCQLDGKMIKDIHWPAKCLLISVKRGAEEIIPSGNTRLIAGDYLDFLTTQNDAAQIKPSLLKMAGIIIAEGDLRTH